MDILAVVEKYFEFSQTQLKVAKFMLQNGVSIKKGVAYIGVLKIPISSIAEGADVDRRVVMKTISNIGKDSEISTIFQLIKSAGPSLQALGPYYNQDVIEISAAQKPGIIAEIASLVAKSNLSIRYLVAESAFIRDSKLIIGVDGKISWNLISQMRSIPGVQSITVYGRIHRSETE